jgi:hypothetical protein
MTSQQDLIASEHLSISIEDIARSSQKLSKIFELKPEWVQVKYIRVNGVVITTRVRRAGGEECFPVDCLVFEKLDDRSIAVKEETTNFLPRFCPERHINSDRTFCVGLRAGQIVLDPHAISSWWKKLEGFIALQQTAHETRKWNPRAAMRHGDAGDLQLQGEEISRSLGCEGAFSQALHFHRGPLHRAKQLVREKSDLLVNGRKECPCGRKSKSGRPNLRKECWKNDLDCLAKILAKIDIAEKKFWENHQDKTCCGTMESCPLRDMRNQPSSAMA